MFCASPVLLKFVNIGWAWLCDSFGYPSPKLCCLVYWNVFHCWVLTAQTWLDFTASRFFWLWILVCTCATRTQSFRQNQWDNWVNREWKRCFSCPGSFGPASRFGFGQRSTSWVSQVKINCAGHMSFSSGKEMFLGVFSAVISLHNKTINGLQKLFRTVQLRDFMQLTIRKACPWCHTDEIFSPSMIARSSGCSLMTSCDRW